jgi:superfamily II DNA or RNA helicase
MTFQLYPYQAQAVEDVRESLRRLARENKRRRTLVVACTGSGKTEIFAEMILRVTGKGGRSLVLVHTKSLVDQTARRLRARGLRVGVERAAETVDQLLDVDVVVCSVQSMAKRLGKYLPGAFALLVCDEAHHTPSATQRKIIDHFVAAAAVGFSASPDRADGTPLSEMFEDVAFTYDIGDAVRDGYLVAPELVDVAVESLDLSTIKFRGGEPAAAELEAELMRDATMHAICRALAQEAKGRKICLFLPGVASVNAAPDMLAQYGLRAAGITGSTPDNERKRIIAAFEAGEYDVLANCMALTEGFDCTAIDCVAIARPTSSRALLVQMAGRGLRLHPGKTFCLVLNFSPGKCKRDTLVCPVDVLGSHGFAHRVIGRDWRAAERERAMAIVADEIAREESNRRLIATVGAEYALVRLSIPEFLRAAGVLQGGDPATDGQLAFLERMGITKANQFSKREASALIDAAIKRRECGLSTYAQAKFLAKYGYSDTTGFNEANDLITRIRANGYRPLNKRRGQAA